MECVLLSDVNQSYKYMEFGATCETNVIKCLAQWPRMCGMWAVATAPRLVGKPKKTHVMSSTMFRVSVRKVRLPKLERVRACMDFSYCLLSM